MRLALAIVLTFGGASLSWSEAPTLVVHVSHHSRQENGAALRGALEKACALPSMKCRVATPLEATTFLRVDVQHIEPEQLPGGLFVGHVNIASRVMTPGSVSAQATSLERLAELLLASVKVRQSERAGVVEVPSGGFGR